MTALDALLGKLDDDQRQAVMHGEGPLLVLAGAGSGKTRVLTFRIAALLARGLAKSHEILALTFTNKAAREMAERVESLLGARLAGGFVGTFHRFALQLLRTHARDVGIPERFAVADETDQKKALDRAMTRLGVGPGLLNARAARSRISQAKNAMLGPEQVATRALGQLDRVLADVYSEYQVELRRDGAIDFDDMLLLSVHLLEAHEAVRRGLQQRFRFILVDEFQDTNMAQSRLIWLLGGSQPNLTVVGDEDQSIYRWRGADVGNILSFDETYPKARVVTLGRNYRSAEPILKAAAGVIRNNALRREKRLTSEAGPGEPVVVYQAEDEGDEARFAVDVIQDLAQRFPTETTAVLYRINASSRPLEAELARRMVPYQVVAGARFWDRTEIRDALAYLRLLLAPDDSAAFRRAIHVPARGIGQVAMEHIERVAVETGVSLPAAARSAPGELTPRARMSFDRFFSLLDELRAIAGNEPAAAVVSALLARSGLADQYSSSDEEDRTRRANQEQLVAAATDADARGLDLAGFLDEVSLLSDADARTDKVPIQLSTLHAAKGLEFDTTILVGLDEGLLPLAREGGVIEDLEEERRLLYVGMTRARRRLVIISARQRLLYGQRLPGQPSRFLAEIPREVVRGSRIEARQPGPPARSATWRQDGATHPERTPGPPPARQPGPGQEGASAQGWRPGLKVRHETFGKGVVLQVQGTGAQTRLVIYFDRTGRKTLLPSIAKLERG